MKIVNSIEQFESFEYGKALDAIKHILCFSAFYSFLTSCEYKVSSQTKLSKINYLVKTGMKYSEKTSDRIDVEQSIDSLIKYGCSVDCTTGITKKSFYGDKIPPKKKYCLSVRYPVITPEYYKNHFFDVFEKAERMKNHHAVQAISSIISEIIKSISNINVMDVSFDYKICPESIYFKYASGKYQTDNHSWSPICGAHGPGISDWIGGVQKRFMKQPPYLSGVDLAFRDFGMESVPNSLTMPIEIAIIENVLNMTAFENNYVLDLAKFSIDKNDTLYEGALICHLEYLKNSQLRYEKW